MGSRDTVISVNHVSKDFLLPHEQVNTLKTGIVQVFSRKRRGVEIQHALNDVTFEIKKGEFFGIVGRNGSGKSTLLKILAGIYQPTSGMVKVTGKLVPFIELGVGFNPELTGRENVYLNGALLGFSKKEVDLMYDDIVGFAELEKFMDQKLKNYSSGMQVRLAFSVAIRAEGDILVLDEVLAVGDAAFQKKCFDYFRTLKREKKTVVFVSHDMGAVREYCDRVVMIEKSKLVKEGSAESVATEYRKLFLEDQSTKESSKSSQQKRWGDRALVLSKQAVNKGKLTDEDEMIEVRARVVADKPVESLVLGFSVKNAAGVQILGMNNNIKKQRIEHIDAGEAIDLTWLVPNIFSNGVHYIDLAAEYDNGQSVADRWEEALRFEVDKEDQTRHVVSPRIDLNIEKR